MLILAHTIVEIVPSLSQIQGGQLSVTDKNNLYSLTSYMYTGLGLQNLII